VEEWLRAERRRGFDWRRAPLLRFHVHRLDEEQFQFTLSFHHAVLDGWSAASLLTELFNRARQLHEQPQAAPEPAPACAFRDFVALELEAEQSPECQAFWREQLAVAPDARLPRHGAPEGGSGDAVRLVDVAIPDDVVAGLRQLTRRAALPLKSLALAAHAKVLALETSQTAVVTGLVSHGRPEAVDGDRVLGLFLNTVPCVLRVGAGSWRELAQAAFDCERRLWPFRRYPLARLQQERGGPLFEVGFNFMHFHVYQGVQQSQAARVEGYSGYEETDLPLTANFFLEPETGRLRLSLNYRRGEFGPAQVERLAARYGLVLAAMARDADARHETQAWLTDVEREQVLGTWSGATGAETPRAPEETVVDWLEAQAARTPAAPALWLDERALDCAELHARANRLARHLRALGVGPETLVAVCLERSFELVVGVLGVLKAGGAYVPLDPANPPARLEQVLEDARPRVVLTLESLAARLPAHAGATVRLDSDWPAIEQQPAEPLRTAMGAGHAAYVIYTSGSTGRPKGVVVTHGGLANYLRFALSAYGVTAEAGAPLHSSVAFDLSVTSLFAPLVAGAPVTLVPDGAPGSELARVLRQERRFSFVKLTPAHLQALALQAPPGSLRAQVGALVIGGEALHAETLRPFREAAPALRVFNEYGPTETVVGSTLHEAPPDITAGAVPIGRPIDRTRVYVLDPHGQPVPPGASGELCIGGAGVARGYLGRPERTAERFVPDAFGPEPGARLYRTGDLARWLPGGTLEYLGRRDQQVKIRGYRVELGEIEAALRRQPGVRDAAALLREDAPGERRLVAYLVARDAPAADATVAQALREALPEYLVPSAFVWLEALPLTANGKLDRARLPAPSGERPQLAEAYVAPRTPVEERLARIWSEVLQVERVGVQDSFFALGGHSLNAMQVIARVRDAFQVELPLRPLFESPTVAALAGLIEEARLAPAGGDSAAPLDVPSDAAADVDRLLDELEALQPEQVRALLGEEA
jgi:amino acid adenylation domain-containing protein